MSTTEFALNNSVSLSTKKDLLMNSLIKFFKNPDYLNCVTPIIMGESIISLRILDWFVTNYSKKNNISYSVNDVNGKNKNFIVYLDYKAQLKAYNKRNFDPFCRRERISFIDHENNDITTTVGQLNFFKWAIENDIITYITENYQEIDDDMNFSLKNLYKKKKDETITKKRRTRTALSISATKTVNKHNLSIIVKFD